MADYLRDNPDLLRRFRDGDAAAVEEVIRFYFPKLDAIVRDRVMAGRKGGIVSPPKASDHYDVLQEVCLRAIQPKARLAYRGDVDYLQFLLAIARNVIADFHRRRAREPLAKKRGRASEPDMFDLLVAEFEEVFVEIFNDPRAQAFVGEWVETLPKLDRAIGEARFKHYKTQEGIADELDISRSKLRRIAERLHRECRAYLAKHGIRKSSVPPRGSPSHG